MYTNKYACVSAQYTHDDMIRMKRFTRCCTFVRGVHPLPMDVPHQYVSNVETSDLPAIFTIMKIR